jgi:glucose/arabinose dehydrogenase
MEARSRTGVFMSRFSRRLLVIGATFALALGSLAPTASAATAPRIALQLVAYGLRSPLFVTGAGDGSGRLFVVLQGGTIKILTRGVFLSAPFLDLHTLVSCCGERGLLGLAFHPQYATNGKLYVNYTDVNGNTVVAEYRRAAWNANIVDPRTRRVLLQVVQPYPNHNGGMLAFGKDGYLYIGLGDGGSAGDPGNRAQSTSTLLGKILRINVNGSGSLPYLIPPTNPFVGKAGLDQIWSYGLRNPWRFSFDRSNGDLWIGDVGQDRYEEIDHVRTTSGNGRGANFGWRVLEGFHCYNPPTGCSTAGKTPPLLEYPHTLGCAVIGGYVYRGPTFAALSGWYLFGDECSGRVWAVSSAATSPASPQLLLDTNAVISSFGQDDRGEVYLVDLNGRIYRIVAG